MKFLMGGALPSQLSDLQSFNRFPGFSGLSCSGSAVPQSLVLGNEEGKLVKASASIAKKAASPEKALAALKSHSEAERRRRERINSHLATLRGLVPCTEKMDKATLLAEVINQVKKLKSNAIKATEGLLIPMDADEVNVELCKDETGDGSFSLRASICCEYRPTLLSEIRKAFEALPLKPVKAEISAVGSRLKNIFIFTSQRCTGDGDLEEGQHHIESVRYALNLILEKAPDSSEYCPRSTPPSKRRRVFSTDSLSSSP
ncbi:hypothetical protein CRG98_008855 [Punica granatum]|uniref:BHLH domain-containing protein n=1 Tax=Punica granatum TaxID=22663 RepID=A0A2I0KR48_PUNGR|nr:hypothetical protein CRG98_008855 [Punica granatum]